MKEGLSEGQIRLLRLQSTTQNDPEESQRIKVHLSQQDIYQLEHPVDSSSTGIHDRISHCGPEAIISKAPPPYIALSYTWGRQRIAVTTLQDGVEKLTSVSPNCIKALEQIHKHFPGVPVWTDTLSIDQGNLPEKAHQINMMGKIYRSAWKVAVWLGSPEELVVNSLYDELVALAVPYSEHVRQDEESSKRRSTLLHTLGGIDWFYRAWTFQEIRLAQVAVVLIEDHAVAWTDFVAKIQAIRKLSPEVSTVTIRSQPESFWRFSYEPQDRFFMTLDELNAGTVTDLAGALFLTWYRDASEQRDKIYSVLSGHLLTSSDHGLRADYDISWSKLCIKTARAAINMAKNLKVLKIAGMIARRKSLMTRAWDRSELNKFMSLPSWAPDWWEPPMQTRSHQSLLFDDRGCFSKLDFYCSTIPETQDVENTSPLLALPGVLLGVIELDNPPSSASVHAPPFCVAYNTGCHTSPDDSDVVVTDLPTYLLVEGIEKHLSGDCSCVPLSERQRNKGLTVVRQPITFAAKPPSLKFGFEKFSLSYIARPKDKKEAEWPAQVLSRSVESGDYLVLLQGGGTPFILRPAKDTNGRIMTTRDMQGLADAKHPLSPEAGCFILVGEASMCWQELWPGRWSRYCRAGTFVLV